MVDLLIIEDNPELGTILCDFLARDGYSLYLAKSGEEGMEFIRENTVRLVLLDVMLPGMDGFGVCQLIRAQGNIPIIIISARVDKRDKIAGLELGADDYVEKPFDIDVLSAKIAAQIRRNYEFKDKSRVLSDGDITIDLNATAVYFRNKPLVMTVKEYELMLLFLNNKGKTLRKEWLFDKVWGTDSFSEPSTLTVHINKLREKIEATPKNPKKIITVWGVGYKYEAL
ncbi:sensory transduction protein regX3 [Ruminiclostridium hungatei]|uniref:Stage 0 sporulation protein A homolog n=1 Tax=Ruminiclostridium hungatei TaxID=48256 RepID=A0A1V4SR15_RUMHU|nr:response regulator transcription factor [Ruminiclostridium hungatei]OPX46302.1 sensory transduction protein regX3 [Ruminiclostridium hungatei]